jgi:UDP-glucose 4-epimerase
MLTVVGRVGEGLDANFGPVSADLADVLETPRVVVTGGAGFVGSALVDRLVDDGLSVLVIDDLTMGQLDHLAGARRHGELQFHQLDVRDELVGPVVTRFGASAVFHLAAQSHPAFGRRHPVADADVNVRGSVNVISACRDAGVRRLVYLTSAVELFTPGKLPTGPRAVPHPRSPTGVAAAAVLGYLRYEAERHDLDYVALGTSTVYGPRQSPDGPDGIVVRIARALLADKRPAIAGDGSATRDLVYVEDVVDAAVKAAAAGGSRYHHVASGVETRVTEIFRRVAAAVDSRRIPEYLDGVVDDLPRSCFDASSARKALGWEPFTTIEEGVAATVDWLRATS